MKKDNYSKLDATLKDNILTVQYNRARKNPNDVVTIDISETEVNKKKILDIRAKSFFYKNKILLTQRLANTDNTLVVYTDGGRATYYIHDNPNTHPLTQLITVKSKVFYIHLTRRGVRLIYICGILNKYRLPVNETYFTIDDKVKRRKSYPIFTGSLSKLKLIKNGISTDFVSMKTLLSDQPPINISIQASLDIDGELAHHTLTRGSRKYADQPKWYYAPITQTSSKGYSVSMRRDANGGLKLVRRLREPIEHTISFRILESKLISFLMYSAAHFVRSISKRNVNIYFEKNANQSQEGAINIFRKARDNSSSKNYFIIRHTAEVYSGLKAEANIVGDFTLKSYWLMYRANNVIATDVPLHMNILRSGNKYVRRAPYTQTYVFLQHGITYLKPHEKVSAYVKNREGEPDYMVVGSKKERDVVVDMLGIEEERTINVGLPIFDNIKHNHITETSSNIVTIMLTYRQHEEYLQDFSKSEYYQTVVKLYKLLSNLVGQQNVQIVAHPKFTGHMTNTSISDAVWKGPISGALEKTKLLITDYSSVCYNVFYQGGSVIFYQPDLELFEQQSGKLIPKSDEYVGLRMFDMKSLEENLNKNIRNKKVDLNSLRSEKYIKNYQMINEYSDGKNVERLYDQLTRLAIL